MDYRETYNKWLNSPNINEEERDVLQSMTPDEAHEAFYRSAEFGTGGMRGIMGPGTNRLNRYTVRMAAKALADMLLAGKETPRVVVAFDTRNNSQAFARETAEVLAGAGVKTYLFDRPSPVPLLSFAVRHLQADGGVVITASHNTREYNGFKVYDETGCQMLPEETERIASAMEAIDDPLAIEGMNLDDAVIDAGMVVPVGDSVIESFLEAIEDCGRGPVEYGDLKVVYTPLHGSGRDYVTEALAKAGFKDVRLVPEQSDFNGDFPTVKKPNPEDPAALEMAAAMARDEDIILGTDPDCDRVGAGVVNGWRVDYITGNQMGILLIDYLCRIAAERVEGCGGCSDGADCRGRKIITTIVSSQMGPLIAEEKGIDVEYVLTGFKYIGKVMNDMEAEGRLTDFLMGYEESYGYLTGTHARDKDGVSTALAICRMAAYHKAHGKTLTDVLAELYARLGYWHDSQESFVFEGADGVETMRKIMEEFRERKEDIFGDSDCDMTGGSIRYVDYSCDETGLPKADVLKYFFEDGSWVAIRPSGTEPKIKVYYCMRGDDEGEAIAVRDKASACIHKLTGAYA